jgi:hypothetical protein
LDVFQELGGCVSSTLGEWPLGPIKKVINVELTSGLEARVSLESLEHLCSVQAENVSKMTL